MTSNLSQTASRLKVHIRQIPAVVKCVAVDVLARPRNRDILEVRPARECRMKRLDARWQFECFPQPAVHHKEIAKRLDGVWEFQICNACSRPKVKRFKTVREFQFLQIPTTTEHIRVNDLQAASRLKDDVRQSQATVKAPRSD